MYILIVKEHLYNETQNQLTSSQYNPNYNDYFSKIIDFLIENNIQYEKYFHVIEARLNRKALNKLDIFFLTFIDRKFYEIHQENSCNRAYSKFLIYNSIDK